MRLWKLGAAGILAGLLTATPLPAITESEYEDMMQEIAELQEMGNLSEAETKASAALQGEDLTPEQRREMEYEIERGKRIRGDYTIGEERMVQILEGRIKDFTPEDLKQWEEMGRVDYKVIDGEKLYVNATASNLFFRYDDINARRIKPETFTWEAWLFQHAMQVKKEVQTGEGTTSARNYHLTMTITVDGGAVPEGEVIRCWMPYPQQFASQYGVRLLDSSPTVKWVNAPDYPQRSLYFEQPSKGEEPTRFQASYTVSIQPRYYDIDTDLVAATDQTANPYYEYFTAEQAPHIVFSPRIRDLANSIVGGETNPAIKARLVYDWVCKNLIYSYAREYSTLRNIPEYVLDNEYGDCGQIALTYMVLCRAVGVPARWQSGWTIYPQWQNLHDWTEIYLAPYGWVPVDPNYGMDIEHGFENLTAEEKEALKDFYFGGLDGYRLTVNREHGYPHFPPKEDFRSDNVDFQRGELEASGKNIYFSDFSYRLETEFLDAVERAEHRRDEGKVAGPMLAPGVAR